MLGAVASKVQGLFTFFRVNIGRWLIAVTVTVTAWKEVMIEVTETESFTKGIVERVRNGQLVGAAALKPWIWNYVSDIGHAR